MDEPVVLFANEAFYLAFAGRDYPAMDAIWSRRPSVTCIHPGWRALIGREAVMKSWRAILDSPDSPRIVCRNAVARVLGDVAYVICCEIISNGVFAATNVFIREDGGWKLIHHQAGASPLPLSETGSLRDQLQ